MYEYVVYRVKLMYSEPLLPIIDADLVVEKVKETYPKLTPAERKRNVKGKIKRFIVKSNNK